jgi:Protein of unknown function (DUF3311)
VANGRSEHEDVGGQEPGRAPNRSASRAWYLLLLPPYVGLLWVPFYAKATPKLFGFPFFYWYQFAWVIGTALLTWIVFRRVR